MNGAESSLRKWLEHRREHWEELAHWADQPRDKPSRGWDQLQRIVRAHNGLASDVALARSVLGAQAELTRRLEALLVATTALIQREPTRARQWLQYLFGEGIRSQMRAQQRRLLGTISIFLLFGLSGWWVVDEYPELAGLVASETMIEQVQGGWLWTDDLLAVAPPSLLSLEIMTNNMVVVLFAFTLGAFYGLGTLYILAINGFMIGGVFAFTARYELADELFKFVIAHGVVELSIVCLAAATGIGLGEALARPGQLSRLKAFQTAVDDATPVVTICLIFLIGAGIIEGYVSPDDRYTLASRIAIGVSYEVLFIATIIGGWSRRSTASPRQSPSDTPPEAQFPVSRDHRAI